MRKRVLVWPAVGLLCFGFAAYASATGPAACPSIGWGSSDLQVGAHRFAAAHPPGVRITLCVAGRCGPSTLIGPASVVSTVDGYPVADPSRPSAITLTAIDAVSGRTVLALRQTVTYERVEPDGKGCGWHYLSYHTLTAAGTLVDAPTTTQPR